MATATAVPTTYELEGDDALRTLRRTGWARLAGDSVDRLSAADGFSHSRALAFQLTLTGLPGLIALVGLATVLDQRGFRRILQETLRGLAPGPASDFLTRAFEQGSSNADGGAGALIVGLLAALFSATVAMGQIERGANRIYGVESDRPPLRKYGTALLLASTAGLLMLAAFVLLIVGPTIADAGRSAGWNDTLVWLWTIARWPAGVVFILGAFALLFKKAPRRRQPAASWLTVGSTVAVVAWLLLTALLALYLELSGGFGQTYGPLAGIIGILVWAYFTSLALFLGLAVAAQLEAVRGGVTSPRTDDRGL